MDGETLERIEAHEEHSARRAQRLEDELKRLEDSIMGTTDSGGVHNVFKEHGAGDGLGMGGLGAGLLGGVLGGALLNRRGIFGADGEGALGGPNAAQVALTQTILEQVGAIRESVPTSALQTQNSLLEQTNALQNQGSQSLIAQLAATASVKEAVGVSTTTLLLAGSQNTAAIQSSIAGIITALKDGTIATLQAELAESRSAGRARETEVNVTQNVNQNQSQAQAQVQLQGLSAAVNALLASHQTIQQGMINLGTMVGNTQTAANTRVNS